MARKTAAERNAEAEQIRAEQELAATHFRAGMPLRMLTLMLEAQELDMPTGLGRDKDGNLVLTVTTQQELRGAAWNRVFDLSINADEWEYNQLVGEMQAVQKERAEAERMADVARTTYDSLSVEQRKALGLKFRP